MSIFFSNKGENFSFAVLLVCISLFTSSAYLYKLYDENINNIDPKFYFSSKNETNHYVSNISKIDSLNNLKEKGILSEDEYNEKTKIVNQEIKEKRLKETEEYKQLESLLNSQLLTREEFENKVNILKEKI